MGIVSFMPERDYKSFFKGKRITVMGLGLLGRGAGDAEFLAKCGAILTVTDLKSEKELRPSLAKLKKYKGIRYVLGKHDLADFHDVDLILKNAGVPLHSPYIAEAHAQGIPVAMSASLFARFSPGPIVGVTGTRGKSTITHLIYEMLRAAGRKVHLGGNVRGVSTLGLLPKVKPGDITVLELDSWQLQGFGEAKISPPVAVFSNLLDDHRNYYKSDPEQYFKDKAQIFLHQDKSGVLVAGREIAKKIRAIAKEHGWKGKLLLPKDLPPAFTLGVPGEHNRENAALAVEAARVLGVSEPVIRETLANFIGLPGRLEFVRELRGVKIYNDTNATTPDATRAALAALAPVKPILIMGGADKELDMKKLLAVLPKHTKKIVLLPGTGTDKLAFPPSLGRKTVRVTNLAGAIREALDGAEKGDVILFSPAFASFGMFQNEYDRGERFLRLVRALK
ncbi:MAG TPA: UDP-N-acetylmuramoyl-L-alanine--D-glutamate ligase [Candidatus Paceibacterota bacterium]|nr:UDP-N-acetylmuramoyl-L-alanine--D-glutamate ligase [Candidatus Paceibacterota bacterium]